MDNEKNKLNMLGLYEKFKTKIMLCLAFVIIVILSFIIVLNLLGFEVRRKESKTNMISKPTIVKMVDIDELNTLIYCYNNFVTKKDEDNDVLYHAYYEATIRLGFNFIDNINIDHNKKTITVTIPEPKINDINIPIEKIKFIFKDGSNNENTLNEAYELSKTDTQKMLEKIKNLLKNAKENAKLTFDTLVKPWLENQEDKYTLIYK